MKNRNRLTCTMYLSCVLMCWWPSDSGIILMFQNIPWSQTNFIEIWIKIQTFSFKKINLKIWNGSYVDLAPKNMLKQIQWLLIQSPGGLWLIVKPMLTTSHAILTPAGYTQMIHFTINQHDSYMNLQANSLPILPTIMVGRIGREFACRLMSVLTRCVCVYPGRIPGRSIPVHRGTISG